jgi:NAD(P)-dependent dehydrogenase (short-subunit alcohol dehydrogenase family)
MPTVLITGANRGLGLEFASQYAAGGWRVIAGCRQPKTARDLAKLAAKSDGRISVHALDVTDRKAIDKLAKQLARAPIDLLINNAGVYGPAAQSFARMDYAGWTATMAVNVMAPLKMAQAFLNHLAAGEQKKIVAMSSIMGSIRDSPPVGNFAYRTSKAALNMLVRSTAIDLRPKGMIAVAMHPGWVRTRMGGRNAPLSPAESVSAMRRTIAGLTLADSGKFLDNAGRPLPW